jgi:hypothetical protein
MISRWLVFAQSRLALELSPAPRARSILLHLIPGLTPRALRCRALRALFFVPLQLSQLYSFPRRSLGVFCSFAKTLTLPSPKGEGIRCTAAHINAPAV